MPCKTELAFFVVGSHDGWVVRADGYVYGPYPTFGHAVDGAVHEAEAAGQFGFASIVLIQSALGQPYQAMWTYGKDPYPRVAVPHQS